MSFFCGNTVRSAAVPESLSGAVSIPSTTIAFPSYYIFVIVISLIIALALKLMLNRTKLGIYLRAIISDRHILFAFRNSGAYTSSLDANLSFEAIIMCMVGGSSSFFGSILGGFIVSLIYNFLPKVTNYYLKKRCFIT